MKIRILILAALLIAIALTAAPIPSAKPIAAFTALPPFIDGKPIAFLNKTSGTVNTRIWTFGDGITSTANNPMHTFRNPGSYAVTLTVINARGMNSITKPILVSSRVILPAP